MPFAAGLEVKYPHDKNQQRGEPSEFECNFSNAFQDLYDDALQRRSPLQLQPQDPPCRGSRVRSRCRRHSSRRGRVRQGQEEEEDRSRCVVFYPSTSRIYQLVMLLFQSKPSEPFDAKTWPSEVKHCKRNRVLYRSSVKPTRYDVFRHDVVFDVDDVIRRAVQ